MPNKQTVTIVPNEGLVRQQGSTRRAQMGFSTLVNARLVPGGNRIEQAPYFKTAATFSQGTYYNGGNQTESASSTVRLLVSYVYNSTQDLFSLTDQIARFGTTQLQVFRQTVFPVADGITKGCLLVVHNTTTLALTLGNDIDVEIVTDDTHFKWRKNGGSYSADIAINFPDGNTLDSNAFTLYWLTDSGFTVGDSWSWQRTDYTNDPLSATLIDSCQFQIVSDGIIFVDPNCRIMKFENGSVRSVGYRPVYGTSVAVYEDHLIVGGYKTVLFNPTSGQTPNVVGSSDLNDFDNFTATDVNEADTYPLEGDSGIGNVAAGQECWRVSVIQEVLFAYTSSSIWASTYQGLPVPFNFRRRISNCFHHRFRGNLFAGSGDYIILTNGIAYFDGSTVRYIDDKINDWFTHPNAYDAVTGPQLIHPYFKWGFYDHYNREMYFYYTEDEENLEGLQRAFLVYQELTDSWYVRGCYFTSGHVSAACMASAETPCSLVFGSTLSYASEDVQGTSTAPLKDFNAGASYQLPTLVCTKRFFGPAVQKTEIGDLYIDTTYTAPAGSGYSTTGIGIELSYTERVDATTSFSSVFTWTTSSASGELSYRRYGRVFCFRVKPVVAANKAPFGFAFNSLDIEVYGLPPVHR